MSAAPRSFPAPAPRELRFRLYRDLAHRLAVATDPSAVVLESASDLDAVAMTVTPGELVDVLLATPTYGGIAEPARGTDLPRPLGDAEGAIWELRPVGAPAPATPTPPPTEAPSAAALLGPENRLVTQTFWVSGGRDGRVWVSRRVRFVRGPGGGTGPTDAAVAGLAAAEWSRATGLLCRARRRRWGERGWASAAPGSIGRGGWLPMPVGALERTAEPAPFAEVAPPVAEEGHTVVLGSTGAGKTTYLSGEAARALRAGAGLLVVDLHGDLAPAIVARLDAPERQRVVAIDASLRPVVGVSAWSGHDGTAAAHLVAAIKRLSPDNGELYWGFRLERLFDGFTRLTQESGGSLGDLYALLTDADRRDAARLATRSPELARFLDELAPIVRRNPEFLWGAAARLAKVALLPELAELLAPATEGVPVEQLLEAGGALLVRLPFASLGPEAAAFAGSLIVGRAYLGAVARRRAGRDHRPIAIVLDEVQGLAPRLVAEMLAEGRKFGVRLVLASQYPERLAPELRAAAAGVSRGVLAFRVPRASTAAVGGWLGLSPGQAEQLLPELPTGQGIARSPGSGELRVVGARPERAATAAWSETVERTARRFPSAAVTDADAPEETTERLLLAVLGAEEQGAPLPPERWLAAATALPGPPVDAARLESRRPSLEREGLLEARADGLHLTAAGERRLGLRPTTGASCESAEHRALLLRAFRIFARHGLRLEILRQGRYDTTLPDARFLQISERERAGTAAGLAAAIDSRRGSWAWRAFRGLDVHVEAEVSGALRTARIHHGLEKAARHGAYALFVVGDAPRAARVRRALAQRGAGLDRAQVWTLRPPNGLAGAPGQAR